MILWPVGAALVIVWSVFRDPAIDFRIVVLGVLVPDLADVWFGGARLAHTLLGPVTVLAVVMLATRRSRSHRRRWLALPIGMLIHLVVDGAWVNAETFWWPFLGSELSGPLPALDRPIALVVALEVAGAGALAWFWVRFSLSEEGPRRRFASTGRVQADRAA